jgi:hypothetical protein
MERQSVNTTSKTKSNLFILYLTSIERLIQLADTAAALHRVELLRETSHALSRLGADEAGGFYQALADGRSQSNVVRSRGILQELSDYASPMWRAKAMLALGTNQFEIGDHRAAETLYRESMKVCPGDSLTRLHVAEMTAQILSFEGNHKGALRLLSDTLWLAQKGSPHYYNHLNSLAVELQATGRAIAAQNVIRAALASPYAPFYPEWSETAKEIRSRSRIAVDCPVPLPDNRAYQRQPLRLARMDNDNVVRFNQKDTRAEIATAKNALTMFISSCNLNVEQLNSLHRIGLQFEASNPDGRKLNEVALMVERELA